VVRSCPRTTRRRAAEFSSLVRAKRFSATADARMPGHRPGILFEDGRPGYRPGRWPPSTAPADLDELGT